MKKLLAILLLAGGLFNLKAVSFDNIRTKIENLDTISPEELQGIIQEIKEVFDTKEDSIEAVLRRSFTADLLSKKNLTVDALEQKLSTIAATAPAAVATAPAAKKPGFFRKNWGKLTLAATTVVGVLIAGALIEPADLDNQ